jgi:hypothetical protein
MRKLLAAAVREPTPDVHATHSPSEMPPWTEDEAVESLISSKLQMPYDTVGFTTEHYGTATLGAVKIWLGQSRGETGRC